MKLEFVVLAAVLQFLIFVSISFFSRASMPKAGLRSSERNLLISAAVAFFAFVAVAAAPTSSPATRASVIAEESSSTGSCASVEAGMSAGDVEENVGKPDEIRDEAEIRGPGAKTWIYRGSRCAVHLLEDRVEFVE